ncbi:hypothetical protein HUJ05_012823 [Dendroctonus ponderosae]|nr:hypothetical protein HUJ05_012823 [Dendroctonus ponderosae]
MSTKSDIFVRNMVTALQKGEVLIEVTENIVDYSVFAKEFVDNLLSEGTRAACDDSVESFNNDGLPPFYDEDLFKRGQAFHHKHIFGMFLGSLLGLLADLSIKSALAILSMTKQSSSDLSAYKRYMSTIFHVVVWYESEFKPGSRLWESVKMVKAKHNRASKKAMKVLNFGINQTDMILAQWGFMGLVVTRSKFLGIHDDDEEGWKSFIHVWRVLGYAFGIQDQFNICRESVAETRAICEEVLKRIMEPEVAEKDSRFILMSTYLLDGLWAMNPFLELTSFLFYLRTMFKNNLSSINEKNEEYRRLSKGAKFRVNFLVFLTSLMRFRLVRELMGYVKRHSLWLMKHFPCLAYYKFGKEHAHVDILTSY